MQFNITFRSRWSFNMIKIYWKFGTRRNDYDANGLTTMKRLHRSRQWSLPIWMSFSWISEVCIWRCALFSHLVRWPRSLNRFCVLLFTLVLGDNVDCWMEIQHGKGPWAPPVSGIVPLGSTLTLVVAINDYRGE